MANSAITNEKIWDRIATSPQTVKQLSRRLNVSTKTVRNGLAEIHSEFSSPATRRAKGNRYVVIENPSRGVRKYAIMRHNMLGDSITHGSRSYQKNRPSGYRYPTVAYTA